MESGQAPNMASARLSVPDSQATVLLCNNRDHASDGQRKNRDGTGGREDSVAGLEKSLRKKNLY